MILEEIDGYSKILNIIGKLEDIKDAKNIFWKAFFNNKIDPPDNFGHGIKILLLNAPCDRFGDVVFCLKIAEFLKEWYNAEITIATTDLTSFKKLGKTKNIKQLLTKNGVARCRRFRSLFFETHIPEHDLVFITPLQSDHDVNLSDVKSLVPYANKFNTFFFSEYNCYDEDKDYDFPTGVGGGKFGLLITKPPKISKKYKSLINPYSVVYIAKERDDVEYCFFSFVKMVCSKYHKNKKYSKFDIVIPDDISSFLTDYRDVLTNDIGKYYPVIKHKSRSGMEVILDEDSSGPILTFRSDIFPISYYDIIGVIQNSEEDVLLTGDQSVTDALSCGVNKNIFYQVSGWKEDFARELSKHLPNKYLSDSKTTCGTLKAIHYKSNYKKFIKEWNFTYLAKPKLDAIIQSINFKKKNKEIVEDLEKIINGSRRVNTIQRKVREYYKE